MHVKQGTLKNKKINLCLITLKNSFSHIISIHFLLKQKSVDLNSALYLVGEALRDYSFQLTSPKIIYFSIRSDKFLSNHSHFYWTLIHPSQLPLRRLNESLGLIDYSKNRN